MAKAIKFDKKILGKKNKNPLSWEESFMLHAMVAAGRSKDPSSQVGACLVGKNNRILSLGYNGAPNGFSDEERASLIAQLKSMSESDVADAENATESNEATVNEEASKHE